jgi:hypothetical protein
LLIPRYILLTTWSARLSFSISHWYISTWWSNYNFHGTVPKSKQKDLPYNSCGFSWFFPSNHFHDQGPKTETIMLWSTALTLHQFCTKEKKTFQDFSLRKSLGLLGHKSKQICIHNSFVLLQVYFLMIQFCCHGKGRGLSIMTDTRDSGFDYNLTRSNCLSTQSTLVRAGDMRLLCM